ncbi:MAG TPA: GxxExxY protein [Chitinophagaceae bacterium]|nr:GxxExxY protein [Chitinophagaceae bacterium]
MEQRNNNGMNALNELVATIIEECHKVHDELGTELYPAVYRQILFQRLLKRGLFVQRGIPVSLPEEEQEIAVDLKAEFIVENSVICEIKSVERLLPAHKKELATYLRLWNKPVGLLINFRAPQIKNGIIKQANNEYKNFLDRTGLDNNN